MFRKSVLSIALAMSSIAALAPSAANAQYTAIVRVAPQLDAPVATTALRRFTPRTTLAYASRAPPTDA